MARKSAKKREYRLKVSVKWEWNRSKLANISFRSSLTTSVRSITPTPTYKQAHRASFHNCVDTG